MKKLLLSLCIFSLISLTALAQPKADLESIVQKHVKNYYGDLYDFMVLPSNAHIKEQIQPNLDWLKKAFEKRGFNTEALPTDGHPVFFCRKETHYPDHWAAQNIIVLHAF